MVARFDLAPLPSLLDGTILNVPSSHGVSLRAALFTPLSGENNGTVCISIGYGGFIERYEQIITPFRQRGYSVVAYDWRGHGGSTRLLPNVLKGHVNKFSDYDDDLNAIYQHILQFCPKPLISFAHSIGCVVLLANQKKTLPYFNKYIYAFPYLQNGNKFHNFLAQTLGPIVVKVGLKNEFVHNADLEPSYLIPFKNNIYNQDPNRVALVIQLAKMRPDLFLAPPTYNWINESTKAQNEILASKSADFQKLPMLFLIGKNDPLKSSSVSQEFASRFSQALIGHIPSDRHIAFLESEILQKLWVYIDDFLNHRP